MNPDYETTTESKQFYIFPKNKEGKSFRVSIEQTFIHLKHKTGNVVTFKRYRHRGQWLWNDSRCKGPCSDRHVVDEVARMLFFGNIAEATAFLIKQITTVEIEEAA